MPSWSACPEPTQARRRHHCCVGPIELSDDAAALYTLFANDPDKNLWDYFVYGAFDSAADYQQWLVDQQASPSQLFYVITDLSGVPLGVAAYLRLDPANGSVEIGRLCFSSKIQRSSVAIEAMYLMMKEAFEVGYRHYEWKCHSLNQCSAAAAQRFGFQFEGDFRQHVVSKGRNRNAAWFSILDSEWPQIKTAFETWLLASNFDQAGRQRGSLADLTKQPQLSVAIPLVDCALG